MNNWEKSKQRFIIYIASMFCAYGISLNLYADTRFSCPQLKPTDSINNIYLAINQHKNDISCLEDIDLFLSTYANNSSVRGKEIEAVYLKLHNDYPDVNSEGYVQYLYSQFTQYPNDYKFFLNHKSTINQLISAVFINIDTIESKREQKKIFTNILKNNHFSQAEKRGLNKIITAIDSMPVFISYTVYSKDGYSNLRRSTSTSSAVIAKLPNGTDVTKISTKNNTWYYVQVEVKGKTLKGYIHKNQLKILD